MKTNKQYIIFIILSVLVVLLTRTVFRVGYNFEFVTSLSIAAGFFFKDKKIAFFVPILCMFMSDLVIGNTNIYIFTWSAFLVAALVGRVLSQNVKNKISHIAIGGAISGLVSTVIFFLWTNLGVVLLTTMYPKTIDGVFRSYVNGLPFVQNQLLGNVFLTPLILISVYLFLNFLKDKRLNVL